MQNQQTRHKALIQIISQETVYSQEELQEKLRKQGIETTQATLSRDLKALHIMKVPGEGYRLPQPGTRFLTGTESASIISLEFSGQMAVIKTHPGFAPAVAARIDHRPCASILGTLAGDDTILLVLRQGFSPEDTLGHLKTIIPNIIEYCI